MISGGNRTTDQHLGRPSRHRVGTTVISIVVTLVVMAFGLPAGATDLPAPLAQEAGGSASVTTEGSTVTVTVYGVPGHQVRVELEDDSIASTALINETGTTQMVFDLSPGTYELEVITFDPAGTPAPAGKYPVTIAGPPPGPPDVTVRGGSSDDNRSVMTINGPAGVSFSAEIVQEGETRSDETGTIGDDGTGQVVFLLENGSYGYVVTLANASGRSDPTTGEFTVDLGTPAPPVLELLSEPGHAPMLIGVSGPAGGRVEVKATIEGTEVTGDADLDDDGKGEVELATREDGRWTVTAVAIDLADQRSEEGTLEGGVVIDREGPPLDVVAIDAPDGEFGFKIVTEPGAEVTIDSDTEELRQTFTAEEEETEFSIAVPGGDHQIEVTAVDEYGNETTDSLSPGGSSGGGSPIVLVLIVVGMLVALGVFAFVRRVEIMDWWNTRQYH